MKQRTILAIAFVMMLVITVVTVIVVSSALPYPQYLVSLVVPDATPTQEPTATPSPALNFPCPQQVSAPAFYALCQEHKILVIQQSFKLKGKQTLTLVAGYADSTSVTLWFHVDTNPDVTLDGSASSPQQANGPGTFSIGAGGCSFGDPNGPLDCLEFFALQHVPAGLRVLDLEIQESVDNGSQDQAPVIAVFRVSLPFHADRVATRDGGFA